MKTVRATAWAHACNFNGQRLLKAVVLTRRCNPKPQYFARPSRAFFAIISHYDLADIAMASGPGAF